jgi:uncharacterized membrane protein YedE/YeeE
MKLFSALMCGWLFALGLGVAGMTQPAKIIAFLDITGSWDSSLLFVMAGAVMVGLIFFPRILRRRVPVLEDRFHVPETKLIDIRLVAGAAIFGVGWGLSGFCPGPAIVSLVTAEPAVLVFAVFMFAGLGIGRRVFSAGVSASSDDGRA